MLLLVDGDLATVLPSHAVAFGCWNTHRLSSPCNICDSAVQDAYSTCCACGFMQKIKWKKLAAEALRANKGKFQMKVCCIAVTRQRFMPGTSTPML